MLVSRGRVIADPVPNAVIEWSGIVQRAIHGPATPHSAGASEILHTMVHLAVSPAFLPRSAFFGTLHVDWTLTTSKAAVPALVKTERRYRNLLELLAEIGNAQVWGGLHRRHALRDGALIGGRVAAHVQWHHFQPTR